MEDGGEERPGAGKDEKLFAMNLVVRAIARRRRGDGVRTYLKAIGGHQLSAHCGHPIAVVQGEFDNRLAPIGRPCRHRRQIHLSLTECRLRRLDDWQERVGSVNSPIWKAAVRPEFLV